MQLQKQRNLKFYVFLVDIFLCNMKLKLRFSISAKLQMRNDVQLRPIKRLTGLLIPENFKYFVFA